MINGLGVLGYGVGGIEAEAVLLGQPLYQPMPRIVGVRLHRRAAADDDGDRPRARHHRDAARGSASSARSSSSPGDGLAGLSLADRATISNMSPEFGATTTLFPIDDETLAYLRLTGRSDERVDLVERYAKAQGLWREPGDGPEFDALLELDLGDGRAVARRAAAAAGPGRAVRPRRQLPRGLPAHRRRRRPSGSRPAARTAEIDHGVGRDRRDHVVHEHLQPDRDGRGRAARPERRRAGPRPSARS